MYHAIVRRTVREGFRALSIGQSDPVLRLFGPRTRFSFLGDHLLGGEFVGKEHAQRWFDLLFKTFPGIQFDVERVDVSGWPWNTLVVTRFHVRATLPGRPYRNQGLQVLRLAWGRIVEDRVVEDTVPLVNALDFLHS